MNCEALQYTVFAIVSLQSFCQLQVLPLAPSVSVRPLTIVTLSKDKDVGSMVQLHGEKVTEILIVFISS
jgi:hypothetical protein